MIGNVKQCHPEEKLSLFRRGDLLESTLTNNVCFKRMVVTSTLSAHFGGVFPPNPRPPPLKVKDVVVTSKQ